MDMRTMHSPTRAARAQQSCPDARTDVIWRASPCARASVGRLDKYNEIGALLDQLEKLKASEHAKVEHTFRVIKRQFRRVKVR